MIVKPIYTQKQAKTYTGLNSFGLNFIQYLIRKCFSFLCLNFNRIESVFARILFQDIFLNAKQFIKYNLIPCYNGVDFFKYFDQNDFKIYYLYKLI